MTVQSKNRVRGPRTEEMGTRLRNLKKSSGKKVLSDGKTIGLRGRLTGAVIDQLSTYYGKAIRANKTLLKI